VLVEAVPELTGALAECPDAREPAGWALEAVGEAHPRAIHEVLPALELAMSTADPDRRARATGVVRKTAAGDPTVVERLVPTLVDVLMTSDRAGAGSDARWALERVALATPAAIEAVIEELGRGLASDDPDVRERTAEVLVETAEADPASVLELVPALTKVVVSAPQAGTDASRALGPVARDYSDAVRDMLPKLTTGLKRDDRDVQAHSAAVVRELAEGSPTAVERVVSTLVEVLFSSESARFDAAWALERVGAADPSALTPHLPRLRAGLASGQTILRERIASVLAETADADPKAVRAAVPELVGTVQECPDARPAATEALVSIGREDPDAIGAELGRLRTSLIGADESARAGTAEILASTAAGDADVVAEAVPELIDRLVDEDAETVRASTSEALGYVASDRPDTVVACRDALARGLGSDDADVRVRTAAVVKRTAERTPSPEALAPLSDRLVDCLDAEEFEVRRDAATALAHIARDATIDLSGARLQLQRLAADPAASTALKSTVVELLSNTDGVVSPDLPSRDERS
jgi:hypothetical protein